MYSISTKEIDKLYKKNGKNIYIIGFIDIISIF